MIQSVHEIEDKNIKSDNKKWYIRYRQKTKHKKTKKNKSQMNELQCNIKVPEINNEIHKTQTKHKHMIETRYKTQDTKHKIQTRKYTKYESKNS